METLKSLFSVLFTPAPLLTIFFGTLSLFLGVYNLHLQKKYKTMSVWKLKLYSSRIAKAVVRKGFKPDLIICPEYVESIKKIYENHLVGIMDISSQTAIDLKLEKSRYKELCRELIEFHKSDERLAHFIRLSVANSYLFPKESQINITSKVANDFQKKC